VCSKCNKWHQTLLHKGKQKQEVNDDKSTTSNSLVNAQDSSAAGLNTYCTLKAKPRNHISPGTAAAEFQNKLG
jgi:hypothetical protein